MSREYIGKKKITNDLYDNLAEATKSLGKRHFGSEAQIIAERNEADLDSPVWDMFGYTRGMRLIPEEGPYLIARDSIILDPKTAQEAVNASRAGKLFYPGNEVYSQHLEMAKQDKDKLPERMRVFQVPERESIIIADNDHPLLRFYAKGKKSSKRFFSQIESSGRSQLTSYMPEDSWVKQNADGTFVQQSWFGSLASDSGFDGSRFFRNRDGAFGVFAAGEADARKNANVVGKNKNDAPYTARQLSSKIRRIARMQTALQNKKLDLGLLEEFLSEEKEFLNSLPTPKRKK